MRSLKLLALLPLATALLAGEWNEQDRGLAAVRDLGEDGQYYALLIANQDYEHLTPLGTPIADVRALAEVLQQDYGFEVTLLENASRTETLNKLDELVSRATEPDNLLIYYAGHGIVDPSTEEGYWLPVTALPNRRAEWIANSTIRDTLKATSARHVLVIADSCFAGSLSRSVAAGLDVGSQRYYEKLANQASRTALTSGGMEPVDDAGPGGHSVFAGVLIRTLRENQDPILEGDRLHQIIRRPVMVSSSDAQQPLYSDVRDTGHDDGDFLFLRSSGAARPVPPPPDVPSEGKGAPPDVAGEKGVPPAVGKGAPTDGKGVPSVGQVEPEVAPRGRPADFITVVQTSRQLRSDWWSWEIHLEGAAWALDEVTSVTYYLHPTFNPPSVVSYDRSSGFQLAREGWGVFVVTIDVAYRDGEVERRSHQLLFTAQ